MTFEQRRLALAETLPDGLPAILVTKLPNVRFLTGFTGSNAAVFVQADGVTVLATDGRYAEQAAAESPGLQIRISRNVAAELVGHAASVGVTRVGFESGHVSVALREVLSSAGVELVGLQGVVESLRECKDDAELRAVRTACAITDLAFVAVTERLTPGVTERQVAWHLLEHMHSHGAEAAAFDSIVAFGPHSAIPHHRPTDRALQRGDLVKLDFGALVDGYHADMTRTVVCGPAAAWQRELHAGVLQVQQRCRDAAVEGAVPVELDAVAQDLVAQTGAQLVHGLGHGVGLEIHEAPFLVPGSKDQPLRRGCTVTVEPGIYRPGEGGVRIEDTVLITDAAPEPLTRSARELLEV